MSEMPSPDTLVYFENDIVPLSQAKVSILTHALHYGTGVFEGIRAYWSDEDEDLNLVRPDDHFARWKANCHILGIDPGKSVAELGSITADLLRLNHFRGDVYVRPLCYMSSARVGIHSDGKSSIAIVAVPFGVYLPSEEGIHAGVVTWRRVEDNAIPSRAKICGAYVNSVLASAEAEMHGYDEAILLNESGHVSEGSACNLFVVRNGKLITPAPSDNILEGITRASILEIARRELHLPVVERSVDRTELYISDEVFLTGTAVEIAPVTRIDRRDIGNARVGPVTAALRELYRDAVHGRLPAYQGWLTPVYRHVLASLAC